MISAVTPRAVLTATAPRRRRAQLGRITWWGAVTVAALGVRLLYSLVIARSPVGIGGDAGFSHSAADLIAHGHFYYRTILGHSSRTAEHPPLYPLLLSVGSLLGAKSLLAHRLMSCAIGS